MTAIESEGLRRRFGKREAVAGVDLSVPTGSVYGFLGQNGAGKTTTIRMVLGLIRPSAGRVRVFGHDVARERLRAARQMGSLVETPSLYDRLTGRENLEIARRLRGDPKSEIDRVLEAVDLTGAAGRLAGGYSQGMRQRLGIARALLGRPDLLVLDEPTNGLDPDGILEFRDFVRSLPARDGTTVFVSSHLLSEVEQVATHVGLMHQGRLLAQDTLAALKAGAGREAEIGVEDARRAAMVLSAASLPARAEGDRCLKLPLPEAGADAALAAANQRLVAAGFAVFRLHSRERSLEDVYLERVRAEAPLAA
jgi:ABC-2 type transport system ATP-binding protein